MEDQKEKTKVRGGGENARRSSREVGVVAAEELPPEKPSREQQGVLAGSGRWS